jgi:hypothetical protein
MESDLNFMLCDLGFSGLLENVLFDDWDWGPSETLPPVNEADPLASISVQDFLSGMEMGGSSSTTQNVTEAQVEIRRTQLEPETEKEKEKGKGKGKEKVTETNVPNFIPIAERPLFSPNWHQESSHQKKSTQIPSPNGLLQTVNMSRPVLPVPKEKDVLVGASGNKRKEGEVARFGKKLKSMNNSELQAQVLKQEQKCEALRKKYEEQQKQLEVLQSPHVSLIKLQEENLYLKEALSLHQHLLPTIGTKFKDADWEMFSALKGKPGEK